MNRLDKFHHENKSITKETKQTRQHRLVTRSCSTFDTIDFFDIRCTEWTLWATVWSFIGIWFLLSVEFLQKKSSNAYSFIQVFVSMTLCFFFRFIFLPMSIPIKSKPDNPLVNLQIHAHIIRIYLEINFLIPHIPIRLKTKP